MDSLRENLYFIVVSAVALLTMFLIIWFNKKIESKKLKLINKKKSFEAVPTSTPLSNPYEEAMDKGIQNIETRHGFIKKISIPFVILIWLAALFFPQLGRVPQFYTSVLVGGITVLLGIAAKPLLENFFSGLIISFGKTIRIGDTVIIDDCYGTVEEISIAYTIVKVWDWKRYVIPNAKLIQKEFTNLSLNDRFVWGHVKFYVSYDSNMEDVKKAAIESVEEAPFFEAKYEAPSFWVIEMRESDILCWVAGWSSSASKAWELKHQIRKNLILKFQEQGISSHFHNIKSATTKDPMF